MENSFKNANFEQNIICYNNSFITNVIGSRKVTTLIKYKAHKTTPHIEYKKEYHEKLGMYTQRRLVIILKIRSKLTALFFTILEDSDIPTVIGSKIREQYPGSVVDLNFIDEKTMYVTT